MDPLHPFRDSKFLPQVPGLELPSIKPREYVLIDHDERMCRVISHDEFEDSYIDNNIDTFTLAQVDWLTVDVDKELLELAYLNGRRVKVHLGSISLSLGRKADHYGKENGVIRPIDSMGKNLFNGANTPQLVFIRKLYHKEARRILDERVRIAEIVHPFAIAIAGGGNARGGSF